MKLKLIILKKNQKRPICPECGEATMVGFTPPREGIVGTPEGYKTLGTVEYVDWNRAHLYCCNGKKNCKFTMPYFIPLTPNKK